MTNNILRQLIRNAGGRETHVRPTVSAGKKKKSGILQKLNWERREAGSFQYGGGADIGEAILPAAYMPYLHRTTVGTRNIGVS